MSLGPVTTGLPAASVAADPSSSLKTSEDAARATQREQAGFAREVGDGWEALSAAADAATDAAAEAMAAEFAINIPITRRSAAVASIAAPNGAESSARSSTAAGLALMGAALAASSMLGLPGTQQPTVNETYTTTKGDSVATVTVNGQGVAISSGSRVFADFTFNLNGTVTNNVTGATATMTGSATAHVEIDACPDANGSSKGKVSLSSKESASNGVGWTRDLSSDFDIAVDDEANTSKLTANAKAQETVDPSTRQPGDGEGDTHGHTLGISTHVEFSVGPGLSGLDHNADALTLEITNQEDAESADLGPLFTSALTAVTAGAFVLGSAAETFWRDGKCIEVIVAPAGGSVDANSTTEVTVKVKHRIDGNELTKPVEATLNGVESIEPTGQKLPAPATFTYTAGARPGDKGDVEFESVSNRGIGKKSVTFEVKAGGWTTNATSPTGAITGTKCNGIGGDWTFKSEQDLGGITITTTVVVAIDEPTLEGTFDFHKDQIGPGSVTTHDSQGAARIVLNEDGSVTMTLDPAKITLHTETIVGNKTVTIQGAKYTYPWTPATGEACSQ